MAQNLARAVTRLVSTSPFMINILFGVQEYSLSVPRRSPSSGDKAAARGKRYLQPKKSLKKRRVTCVIFSSLPSSSGSLALAASNRAETTPNSLRSACSRFSVLGFGFRPDPVTPVDLSSLLVMAVPCCVLSSRRGPFLSLPCPSLLLLKMCYQPLTSPENLQKTAHQHAVKTHIFRAGLCLILLGREKNDKKGGGENDEKRKRDQDVKSLEMYPRFLQVKKQPPLSGSVFIAYIRPAYMCTHARARALTHAHGRRLANKHIHTHTRIHTHLYIPVGTEMGKK